ncbi:MAG: hypothetical protein IJ158_05200 [Treponema sp.]|nr:hypothetical protein [Treponema sp.]
MCYLFVWGGVISCSNDDDESSSSDPQVQDNGSKVSGDLSAAEQESLYGSYWGSLTVSGTSYDMCLVVGSDGIALKSTMMTQSYSVVKYSKNNDGTFLAQCYNSGEDTSKDTTHVSVTFTLSENSATCVPCIVPMKSIATFATCTRGTAYNGEYDG